MRAPLLANFGAAAAQVRRYAGGCTATARGQFGSFANDDVEALILLDDVAYKTAFSSGPLAKALEVHDAAIKFTTISRGRYDRRPAPFGQATKEQHFMIDPAWTFLNHGAFGAPLRVAYDSAAWWRDRAERQPLRFIDRELLPALVHSLRLLATHVGADRREVALVSNATAALNAVIASRLGPGDSCFVLSTGYGSVKKMILRTGAAVTSPLLKLDPAAGPLRPDDVVELVARTLPDGCKLAVFDHVTSNTAMLLPVAELVDLCRSRGVEVLIDGAHGPGSPVSLDIASLRPDYYVGNCHKWLCCPRGAGFLHARSDLQAGLLPAVTSHGGGHGFVSEFLWDGARDYSSALSIPAALHFWDRVVPADDAWRYMRSLCCDAADMLTKEWWGGSRADCPGRPFSRPEMWCGAMDLVPLPPWLSMDPRYAENAQALQDWLHHNHRIEVPVKRVDGRLYVRISAAIYNEMSDYERLAEALRLPPERC